MGKYFFGKKTEAQKERTDFINLQKCLPGFEFGERTWPGLNEKIPE
jgi:hypothetical protein